MNQKYCEECETSTTHKLTPQGRLYCSKCKQVKVKRETSEFVG